MMMSQTMSALRSRELSGSGVERLDVRVGLVALSAVFYALTFLPLYDQLGPGVVSLSVVPVALAGWLFGLRAGLLAGAIAFPLNTVLLGVEESAELNSVVWGGAVAGSAALLVGTVAGTLRDVAERLQTELASKHGAEEGLRLSEERLRHLVENAPGTLITVDGGGTVLFSNRPIGGLDAAAVRGTNVYNFVPRRHQDIFRRTLERVFQTGEPGGYEIAETPEEGDSTLHIIRFGPVEQDGRVVAATLLSLDVTDSGF
jgi:PAS domain S-box-containing protein